MTLEQFAQSWEIAEGIEKQSAKEALSGMAAQLGIELKLSSQVSDAAKKMVQLDAGVRNHFEVIEEICRRIERYPVYESVFGPEGAGVELHLKRGKRPYPVAFAGPFMFEVREIDEYVPFATGRLQIVARSVRFPDSVMWLIDKIGGMHGPMSIDEVTHTDVGSLVDENGSGGGSFFGGGMFDSGGKARIFEKGYSVALKNLLRRVTAISTISGGIEVRIPMVVKQFHFDRLKADQKQTDSDVEVVLVNVEGEGPYMAQFKVRGGEEDGTQVIPLDAQEKPMATLSFGSFGFNDEMTSTVTTEKKPSGYSVGVVQRMKKLIFPIEFSDVPLARFAEMPEKLEPLEFGSHDGPLECEFVKITGKEGFRQVLVRVTNHSNKDAGNLTVKLEFLDADGNKLEETDSTQGGNMGSPGGGPTFTVRAGLSREMEFVAFFMPEETKSVRIAVKEVHFADATTWTP